MPVSPAALPPVLLPFADAMDLVAANPRWDTGWRPWKYDQAPPCPLIPGAPPHDGVYRGSWISPGICLRLDLEHPAVGAQLRTYLRTSFSGQVGGDGGFYEYGIEDRSQRTNREQALARLAARVEAGQRHG